MSPSSPCPASPRDRGGYKPPVPPRRLRGSAGREGGSAGRARRAAAGSWRPGPGPGSGPGSGPGEPRLKCVLVGDGAVGKTSLVVSYTTNGYPTEYVPTAFDNFSAKVSVDGQPVKLQLCDTAGQDEFDKLRPLCYTSADVFLLCFSVVSPASFQNVPEKWIPEIRNHAPFAPIILVGTQCDLREDVKVLIDLAKYREQPVDPSDAQDCAVQIGAVAYVECSSLTQKNLKEVFDTAILASLNNNSSCKHRRGKQKHPKKQTQAPNKMKSLSKSWWKRYCCVA